MILQSQKNKNRLYTTLKELTFINEMSITVGFIYVVYRYFKGVWANESWGRYWGWDPKETWALASMLVYIFVLHMRFIPKLKSIYAFNLASLLAFSSIIMTYFGLISTYQVCIHMQQAINAHS